MYRKLTPGRFVLAALLLVAIASDARSQSTLSSPLDPWLQSLRIGMLDQRSGYGGLFSDRGSSPRYTPSMDHEYHIDLRSAGFDEWRVDGWHRRSNGVRSYAGSIHRSAFATTTDVRHLEQLTARQAFLFAVRQQDDLSARRLFLEVGYDINVTGRHVIGVRHTGGGFKPDLDAGLVYRADLRTAGFAQASVTFLDYANNFIYDVLGTDPALDDTVRSYRRIPVLLEGRWHSPINIPIDIDIAGGLMLPAHADIERWPDPSFSMSTRHTMRYAAAALGYRTGWLKVGLAHRYSEEARAFSSAPGSTADRNHESRQRTHWSSVSAAGSWPAGRSHDLRVSLSANRLTYIDRQEGTRFSGSSIPEPFRLEERRWESSTRVDIIPIRRGLRGGIALLTDSRDYREGMDVFERHYLTFRQWSPNQRFSLHAGHQVRPGAFIDVGVSIDIDGDDFYTDGRGMTRFDGGFGRLQVTW
jgi:hypothetical protein